MASLILVTKLFIPATRPELVPRPRLTERLNGGLDCRLTLISAPAGFGKTTVVTEWLQARRNDTSPPSAVAWLSLDERDNDPARFLTYFIAALNRTDGLGNLGEEALATLQSPQPLVPETILIPLINEIAEFSGQIIFVLDDYHLIEAQPVNTILGFLLENLPPQVHLVITTREDPLLPLSRLRARGQLVELRAADLRFTTDEAAEFLNQVMGLNLSTADVVALENRTEGWIAGLQLAAISMRGQKDTARLIHSFTGSNRLVLDYLIDEVLHQQPPAIQDFLLTTAVLNRLTGPLCDAVRDRNDLPGGEQESGQVILESLERANLFIISLDNERQWYRYHHLFADLLRQRLHQTSPEQEPIYHSRASRWYERQGLMDEAIEHTLQAGDFQRGASLIAELVDVLWKRGEHLKLRGWLEKLPEDWLCTQPQLCIYQAWFLFSTGRQELAERQLKSAERAIAASATQETEAAESRPGLAFGLDPTQLEGRVNAVRAMVASWGEDFSVMIRHASLACQYLPKGDPWRSMAEVVLGDAYYYRGDIQAAYQTRCETLEDCRPEDDRFYYMIANLKVATSLHAMGQLKATIEICQRQLEFAQQNRLMQTIFAGWAMGLMGVTLAERNELEQALELTAKYIELTKGNDLAFVGSSHIFRARAQLFAGDLDGAENTLHQLADIGRKHYLPRYIYGRLKAWQAQMYLAQDRYNLAAQLIQEDDLDIEGEINLLYDDILLTQVRLQLFLGRPGEAVKLLTRLLAVTEARGHISRQIEVLALLALALQVIGDLPQALDSLSRALNLAEPGGYVHVFVVEGPPMARLLYEALSRGIALDYVQHLLAAFPNTEPKPSRPVESQPSPDEFIEPLSERELDILNLIAEGLTNQEIATRLYLSLNTVKAHTRNIYGKLNVNSRTQAIIRSQAFGLLTNKD